ncbi:MAG: hypothetical protein JPMHGGIA_01947 [Saprospiraceae bacterium]|nr:hypothetical protein [Saprospiraceae bacterium]
MNKPGNGKLLDSLFKKKLEHFELKAGDHVWEKIARHLDNEKRRPFAFGNWNNWVWVLVLTGLLLGLAGLFWYLNNHKSEPGKKDPVDLPMHFDISPQEGLASINSDVPSPKLEQEGMDQRKSGTGQLVSTRVKKNKPIFPKGHGSRTAQPLSQPEEQLANETSSSIRETGMTEKMDISNENADAPAGNELIASSDPMFLAPDSKLAHGPLHSLEASTSATKHEISALTEGCEVYQANGARAYVDAYVAPEIAYRRFSAKEESLLAYADKRERTEKPLLSYATGIRASFVLGSGIAFRTGVSFAHHTERIDYVKETQTITIERKDKDGNVIGTETIHIDIMESDRNKFTYIDIPVMVAYEKDLKDFILSVNGGFGINAMAKQSGKIYKPDQSSLYVLNDTNGEGENNVYRSRAGISLLASVGLNYKYNDRILLMLEPSMRYYLKPITADNYGLEQRYAYFGLNAGIRYRIR